jgi:hypothetical protein
MFHNFEDFHFSKLVMLDIMHMNTNGTSVKPLTII